ncbi:hypothetical protein [Kitasatospora purpeofusca]|uniref:hypothetical protein n=1 Tax=Kitasatospora purpeofusca TaxID=67352 RepID=UPI0036A0F288
MSPLTADFRVPAGMPVVANLGMGVDSSAYAARWLTDPASRGFDLDQLTFLIAAVGEEYGTTHRLMEECLFPLIARHRIRTVTVARKGHSTAEGYLVLDDTRTPTRLRTRPADEAAAAPVSLGERMLQAGTLPQVSRDRRACSSWIKHFALDSWIKDNVGGAPFVHVIGYSAEEPERSQTDLLKNRGHRRPDFPLQRWGWGRQRCEDFLLETFGRRFVRSCCGFCPFQGTKAGREALVERWAAEPDLALRALLIEHSALVHNERALLFGSTPAYRVVAEAGLNDVLAAHQAQLAAQRWAIYEVRRIYWPHPQHGPAKKGQAWRSVRAVATGSLSRMTAELPRAAAAHGGTPVIDRHGITRVPLLTPTAPYPAVEHFLALGPALAADKQRKEFEHGWSQVAGPAPARAGQPRGPIGLAA